MNKQSIDVAGFDSAQHDNMINNFARTIEKNNEQKAYFTDIQQHATPRELSLLSIQELKEKFGFKEFRYKLKQQNTIAKTNESVNRFAEMAKKSRLVTGVA